MASNDDSMYGRVGWMVAADEAILRLLAAPKQLELAAGDIAHNTGYERSHVHGRLNVLIEKGAIERVELEGRTTRYTTAGLGQEIVDQEVSAEDLEDL